MLISIISKYPLISLIFFVLSLLKFINILNIPPFGDEILYLYLADEITKNPQTLFKSISFGVYPLYIWFLAIIDLLNNNLINPLFLGRVTTTFFDLVSALLVFKIGENLFSKKVGIISSIVYLTLPLTFFHGRFVLLESPLNTTSLTAIWLTFYLNKTLNKNIELIRVFLISLLLAISFFIKPLAIVYFPAIFLIFLVGHFKESRFNFKFNKLLFLNFVSLLALTILLISIFYIPTSLQFNRYIENNSIIESSILNLKNNLWLTLWWTRNYLTLPILFLTILVLTIGLIKKNLNIIWLGFWISSIIVFSTLLAANYYPRHLYPISAPVSLIIAVLINKLVNFKKLLGKLSLLLILTSPILFNLTLIKDPQLANLALEDKQQFFEDWSAGGGLMEIAEYLKQTPGIQNSKIIVESEPSQFWALSNLYGIPENKILISKNLYQGKFVEDELLEKNKKIDVFVILNKNPDAPVDWPLELIYTQPKGANRNINLYKLSYPL